MAQLSSHETLQTRLSQHWQRQPELTLRPPAGLSQIEEFEGKYGVTLSEELRSYFQLADGFSAPRDQDSEGFCFWPLERIVPCSHYEHGRFGDDNDLFLFADYLGLSWLYGVRLRGVPRHQVELVGKADGVSHPISGSFGEFLELYLVDDERLYGK